VFYYAATRNENVYVIVHSVVNRRVALNRAYNALRGERRERARVERLAEPNVQPNPQADLLRAEERARVRAALARLSERQS
jgi:DNA-directed RNA polymerase specialized sigma24 family protein